MANISKINGFKPVKHITGAPYSGQANIYAAKSGEKFVAGDPVKLSAGASQGGVAEVTVATNDAAVLGVVVGQFHLVCALSTSVVAVPTTWAGSS